MRKKAFYLTVVRRFPADASACALDADGDGVPDSRDNCPHSNAMSATNFHLLTSQQVQLDPRAIRTLKPRWRVNSNGTEVEQTLSNPNPALYLAKDRLSSFQFTGTLFIYAERDDDYAGLVFNYQSNRRFMLVTWKKNEQRYWLSNPFRAMAKPGLQIKMIRSSEGPGNKLRNAIWHSNSVRGAVSCIYALIIKPCRHWFKKYITQWWHT